jgi:hypothetical protein
MNSGSVALGGRGEPKRRLWSWGVVERYRVTEVMFAVSDGLVENPVINQINL